MLQRIPTTSYPLVTQQSDLDGVTYSMRFRWAERTGMWHLDLRTLDDDPIALSVALVTGWPLLRRCLALGRPPGELMLLDLIGDAEQPTQAGFGTRWCLYYAPIVDLIQFALTGELPP